MAQQRLTSTTKSDYHSTYSSANSSTLSDLLFQLPSYQREFYKGINSIAHRLKFKDHDGSYTKRYFGSSEIPYFVADKNNTRAVFIKAYREPRNKINFPDLDPTVSDTITIHVTEGTLIIRINEESKELRAYSSCKLNLTNANITGRIERIPTNFAIILQYKHNTNYVIPERVAKRISKKISPHNDRSVIQRKSPIRTVRKSKYPTEYHPIKQYNQTRIIVHELPITKLPDQIKPVPMTKNKAPISFIRAELSPKELRDRIIFLDTECVMAQKEHVPASLTLINYDGQILLDKIIRPEKEVTNYITRITGFTPQTLKNGVPEQTILSLLKTLLVGKILIGSDLTQDIKVLEINKDDLLGIRDLSTALAIKRKLNIWDHRVSLSNMVNHFLNQEIHKKGQPHSSLTDTTMIREIYLKIEQEYEDDYYDQKEELFLNNELHTPPNKLINDPQSIQSQVEIPVLTREDRHYVCDLDEDASTPILDEPFHSCRNSPEPVLNPTTLSSNVQKNSEPITSQSTVNIPETVTTNDGKILYIKDIVYSDSAEVETCYHLPPHYYK